jgi:AmpD protein
MSAIAGYTDGWLRGARRIDSPNHDARPPGEAIDLVVVHAISLPPGQFGGPYVRQLFTNTLDGAAHPYFAAICGMRVSAHFLIERAGAVLQFVDVHRRAWHAGVSCWQGRTACNDFSLGIELEGADDVAFTDAQYEALVGVLRASFAYLPALSRERVVGHSDVAPGRKTDPGPMFDWVRLREAMSA